MRLDTETTLRKQRRELMKVLLQMGMDEDDVIGATVLADTPEKMQKLTEILEKNNYEMTSSDVLKAALRIDGIKI